MNSGDIETFGLTIGNHVSNGLNIHAITAIRVDHRFESGQAFRVIPALDGFLESDWVDPGHFDIATGFSKTDLYQYECDEDGHEFE